MLFSHDLKALAVVDGIAEKRLELKSLSSVSATQTQRRLTQLADLQDQKNEADLFFRQLKVGLEAEATPVVDWEFSLGMVAFEQDPEELLKFVEAEKYEKCAVELTGEIFKTYSASEKI